jgi:hypothetical protein
MCDAVSGCGASAPPCREYWSRLNPHRKCTINVTGGVTGIVRCELYIDAGKLGGLACATQRVGSAKMDQVSLSSVAAP